MMSRLRPVRFLQVARQRLKTRCHVKELPSAYSILNYQPDSSESSASYQAEGLVLISAQHQVNNSAALAALGSEMAMSNECNP